MGLIHRVVTEIKTDQYLHALLRGVWKVPSRLIATYSRFTFNKAAVMVMEPPYESHFKDELGRSPKWFPWESGNIYMNPIITFKTVKPRMLLFHMFFFCGQGLSSKKTHIKHVSHVATSNICTLRYFDTKFPLWTPLWCMALAAAEKWGLTKLDGPRQCFRQIWKIAHEAACHENGIQFIQNLQCHLSVITGHRWAYTFHKNGVISILVTGILGRNCGSFPEAMGC